LVKKLVYIFTGAWVAGMIVVFGWWGLTNYSLVRTNAEYLEKTANFKPELVKIAKGQLLRSRLQIVKTILATRFEYGQAFLNMTKLFNEEVKVEDFKLTKEGIFLINVKSYSTRVMEMVEAKLIDINSGGSEVFSKMKLIGIEWNNGAWLVQLEVKVINGK